MAEQDFKKLFEDFQEKHENIMNNISDIVFHLNSLGFIEYVNSSVKIRLGYNTEELIGKHLKITTPLDEVPRAVATLKRVFSGEVIKHFEIKQKTADGRIIDTEINLVPVKIDGKIVKIQGVMRDVSVRKEAERKLEERVKERENTNKVMAERELKIIELKKKINELLKELGQPKRFNV